MKKTSFTTRKVLFTTIFIFLLVCIPIIALVQKYTTKPKQPVKDQVIEQKMVEVSPVISPTSNDTSKEQHLFDLVHHRRALSQTDQMAKQHIISLLPQGEHTGTLYQTSDITIEYIQLTDLFQVEIKTDNIPYAKAKAVSWFKNQGVSYEGICNYPLSFYLTFDLLQQMKETQKQFNPLPDGC